MAITLFVLFLVPATHLVRFDAWSARHWVGGRRVDGLTALGSWFLPVVRPVPPWSERVSSKP